MASWLEHAASGAEGLQPNAELRLATNGQPREAPPAMMATCRSKPAHPCLPTLANVNKNSRHRIDLAPH